MLLVFEGLKAVDIRLYAGTKRISSITASGLCFREDPGAYTFIEAHNYGTEDIQRS
jgi:hypothetical protein